MTTSSPIAKILQELKAWGIASVPLFSPLSLRLASLSLHEELLAFSTTLNGLIVSVFADLQASNWI